MKRKATSGISQLEMMIALIIMGMIAVLMANVLDFNRKVLVRATGKSHETSFHLARQELRGSIEALPIRYGDYDARHFFEGEQTQLNFRQSDAAPSATPTTLQLNNALLQISGGKDGIQHPTLADQAANLAISYFGRISGEQEKRWHDSWSDPIFLPDLVKIEWELTDARPAPPLTLMPAKIERQRYISLSSLVPPG